MQFFSPSERLRNCKSNAKFPNRIWCVSRLESCQSNQKNTQLSLIHPISDVRRELIIHHKDDVKRKTTMKNRNTFKRERKEISANNRVDKTRYRNLSLKLAAKQWHRIFVVLVIRWWISASSFVFHFILGIFINIFNRSEKTREQFIATYMKQSSVVYLR
jgi:hypothetical protein